MCCCVGSNSSYRCSVLYLSFEKHVATAELLKHALALQILLRAGLEFLCPSEKREKDISASGAYLFTGCNWPFWVGIPLPFLTERKRQLGFRSIPAYGLQLAVLSWISFASLKEEKKTSRHPERFGLRVANGRAGLELHCLS